jgi:quercetin dioxygenase-like cupin family protein
MAKERQWGDVGTELLFENNSVKIWDLSLAPGQSSHWHRHDLDYVTVGLTESRMMREFEDGTVDESLGSVGRYRFAEKHGPHVVTNIGDAPHRNILIEIKETKEPSEE